MENTTIKEVASSALLEELWKHPGHRMMGTLSGKVFKNIPVNSVEDAVRNPSVQTWKKQRNALSN